MQSQMLTSKLGGELISYKLDGIEKIHQGQDCTDANGKTYTIFIPLSPFETPSAIQNICEEFNKAISENDVDPLILISIFSLYNVSVVSVKADSGFDTDYDSSGSVQDRLSVLENQLKNMENSMLDKIYPIGSIYMNVNSTNPSNIFGGTWE